MATTISAPAGARTQYPSLTLTSVASANYVASGSLNLSADDPLDVIIEVTAKTPTVGNGQLKVFVQCSLDNTNWTTGPTSSTTTTNEPDLHFIGVLPMKDTGTHTKMFSMLASLGFIPPYHKLVCFNDTGGTLDGTVGAAYYSVVTGYSA